MKSSVLALAAVLAAGPVAAKSISITMTPVAELSDSGLNVRLTVGNVGDEAAQSVATALYFGDHDVRGKGAPSLAPQATLLETLSLPTGELKTGRWPYRVTVDYTDANQYPFQALHVLVVTKGSPPPSKVTVPVVSGGTIATSGSLTFTVKNMADVERTAAVQVVVPEGLEVTRPVAPVTLTKWEEKSLSVPIANRTALAGSRLPVFVSVQYDDGDTHQATVAQGILEIVPAQSFFAQRSLFLVVGAAILILAWGGFLVARLMRRT
jgi:hypothetical protein